MKHNTPMLIGIGGPSGSGKSTAARSLIARYPFAGRFKFDDFFKDASEVERHPLGYRYWDHPDSIKWDALVEALRGLKRGEVVEVPHYERALNRQDGVKRVAPSPVIFVDGYQVLYDPRLRELLDVSFYFDLPEELQITRRIARQPDVDRAYLYHVMLPAARAYLWPTRIHADHLIQAAESREAVLQQCRSILQPYFAKLQAISKV